MALDILILGMLRAGPVHGYELKRRVRRPTLALLSNNSLYPSLRRFEEAGAVTRTVEEQDGKPARKVYEITERGRRLFDELISTLPPELASSDEEFLVRLGFFDELEPARREGILAARMAVLDEGIEQVRALLAEDRERSTREWTGIAMEHRLDRLEHERRWIAELTAKAGERTRVAAGAR